MPRQLDQLPADATSLARRVQDLERQVREMRGARRMTAASVGTLRVYADDGTTLLAEIGLSDDGGGGLSTFGLTEVDAIPVMAALSSGRLRFQAVDSGLTEKPAYAEYTAFAGSSCDLALSSGSVRAADWAAVVDLNSFSGGDTPTVLVAGTREVGGVGESGACNMDVAGTLTAANIVTGSVAITPSAANTPTSVTVSGLSVPGAALRAFTAIVNPAPGSTGSTNGVTGTGYTNLSSTGLTVWATRQNTTAVTVVYGIIGTNS